MDNNKIGKLIADLRRKKGLTQQELGDMVGVGFRAVSKWERGITLPDITIINEVSKILGISSDELLSGKVNKEKKEKKKFSPKIKITLLITIILVVAFASILAYNNKRTYVYDLSSMDSVCYVEGQVIARKDNIQIIINKLNFEDKSFLKTEIRNYEYQVMSGDRLIVGFGNTDIIMKLEKIGSIQEFVENFNINYNSDTDIKINDMIEDGLIINVSFETETYEKIDKTIELKLTLSENKNV